VTNEEALVALAKELDRVKTTGATHEHDAALRERVAKLGLESRIGWVLHTGRVADGTLQVQFNEGSDGWSSRWPAWAYEPARDALLHGKKLLVISNGVPYGPSLLQVVISN